jgi:hypothetical protein
MEVVDYGREFFSIAVTEVMMSLIMMMMMVLYLMAYSALQVVVE